MTLVYTPERELNYISMIGQSGPRVIFGENYAVSVDQYLSGEPTVSSTWKLLDIDTGRLEDFPRLCPGFWRSQLSPDRRQLFYSCRTISAIGQLRVYDIGGGTHRLLAEFDGQVTDLSLSEPANRFLVDVRRLVDYLEPLPGRRRYLYATFLVTPDGDKTELNLRPYWLIREWSGDARLVVFGRYDANRLVNGYLDPSGFVNGYLDPDGEGLDITIVTEGGR